MEYAITLVVLFAFGLTYCKYKYTDDALWVQCVASFMFAFLITAIILIGSLLWSLL